MNNNTYTQTMDSDTSTSTLYDKDSSYHVIPGDGRVFWIPYDVEKERQRREIREWNRKYGDS